MNLFLIYTSVLTIVGMLAPRSTTCLQVAKSSGFVSIAAMIALFYFEGWVHGVEGILAFFTITYGTAIVVGIIQQCIQRIRQ